jgi:anthranilate synthase component 1
MSFNFSPDEFEKRLKKFGAAVLFKKIPADVITPLAASIKVAKHFPNNHFLLESAEKGNNKGRFSVLGFMPDLSWKCEGGKSFLNKNFAKNPQDFIEEKGEVLENLRALIRACRIEWADLDYMAQALPAVASGIFGYINYDMARFMEKIPNRGQKDEIQIPDAIFIRPQIIIVFDNLFDCALICAPAFLDQKDASFEKLSAKISLAEKILSEPLETLPIKASPHFEFSSNCSKEKYCHMVEAAKKYITSGDIFQVLPSQRFTSNFDKNIPEFAFYRALRSINPSPFLFFLKFDDFVLSGASPEIMTSVKNKKVTIRPLAGTRKRGKNAKEDKEIAAELLRDEKEIAEHLMLIDLGRHDVGRVAAQGSVVLTEKMVIEHYSHVMHISSNVEGILRDDLEALDALISGFPAGTVSGAPKIRAMEIIEELEDTKRSFYAGCVGYFASNGDMENCITLRSALIKNGKIYLQSGAGVVFDSKPELEHQECINKAYALMQACENIKNFL